MQPFILVTARDRSHVRDKLEELRTLGIPFVIICGERLNHEGVRYRKPSGKWDAINFGSQFIPSGAQIVVLNDVDSKIHHLEHALTRSRQADLIYCKVRVKEGPQTKFYKILDTLRGVLPVAASGELMVIKRRVFNRLIPIPPCAAEDTYMVFRALELGHRVEFCTETYVTTKRTNSPAEEQAYKLRTTLGVYHALELASAPPVVKAFYFMLPLVAPLLALGGPDGRAWAMGIELATAHHFLGRYSSKF